MVTNTLEELLGNGQRFVLNGASLAPLHTKNAEAAHDAVKTGGLNRGYDCKPAKTSFCYAAEFKPCASVPVSIDLPSAARRGLRQPIVDSDVTYTLGGPIGNSKCAGAFSHQRPQLAAFTLTTAYLFGP
jgi:hypothetical protein